MLNARNPPLPLPSPPPSGFSSERVDMLIGYTAALNPRGVRRLIYAHGYDARHQGDLKAFLLRFLTTEGAPALDELLAIHPDRELILETLTDPAPDPAPDLATTLPTSLARAGAGISRFDGPAANVPVAVTGFGAQLAALIAARKEAVVDVVNRHGAAVLYTESARAVAAQCVEKLLSGNAVFVRELGELTAAPEAFGQAWQGAAAAVPDGPVLGSALLGQITVSLGNDPAGVSRAKQRLGLALGLVSVALVAALLFIFFHGRLRGAK